ncbi:MAG: hypothetical protein U9O94_01300 [Nanoarchaeota archaeon]|nr:hypothetical protein [Nanoarchaeota archaeon]
MPKKLKTMDIKRKNKAGQEVKVGEYVTVNERVKAFHDLYPKGNIETQMIRDEAGSVTMKAVIIPDIEAPTRFFTGYAKEKEENGWINKTDCLENCETSAVGRALGFLGIGIDQAIATVEDIKTAMKAYSGIEMPKAVKEVSDSAVESPETAQNEPESNDVVDNVNTAESPVIEPSGAISKEKAKELFNIAQSNGYEKDEFFEIAGKLGYDKVTKILWQDLATILEEISKPAVDYRKKKEQMIEEAWNE